jgi:hypothetical protein
MEPFQAKRLSVVGMRVMLPRSSFATSAISRWIRLRVIWVDNIGVIVVVGVRETRASRDRDMSQLRCHITSD